MWVLGGFLFIAGVAVSRLTHALLWGSSRIFWARPFPGFLDRKKFGDSFALSLISLSYILPNLLNEVQTYRKKCSKINADTVVTPLAVRKDLYCK
jgi:hypothetical protein